MPKSSALTKLVLYLSGSPLLGTIGPTRPSLADYLQQACSIKEGSRNWIMLNLTTLWYDALQASALAKSIEEISQAQTSCKTIIIHSNLIEDLTDIEKACQQANKSGVYTRLYQLLERSIASIKTQQKTFHNAPFSQLWHNNCPSQLIYAHENYQNIIFVHIDDLTSFCSLIFCSPRTSYGLKDIFIADENVRLIIDLCGEIVFKHLDNEDFAQSYDHIRQDMMLVGSAIYTELYKQSAAWPKIDQANLRKQLKACYENINPTLYAKMQYDFHR